MADKEDAPQINPEDLKGRIVEMIDKEIVAHRRRVAEDGGTYTRPDSTVGGSYSRPDRLA